MEPHEIAYVLLRFPHLTETFVAEEMRAIRDQAAPVRILSLLTPVPGPVHAVSKELIHDAEYAPGLISWKLWWAQIYFILSSPRKYFRLLFELLREPCPARGFLLKRWVIFVKAVALAKQLQGSSIKLLHTHFAWLPGAATRVMAELLNLPYTVTTHAYDIYSIENDLLCLTVRSAAHIVTISEYNKVEMLRRCPGLDAERISIIHCGVDTRRFSPQPHPVNHPLSIVAVGSLIEKKGHQYLVRACRRLKEQGVHFKCTIIGRGKEEANLRQLIADLNLEPCVTLAGAQDQQAVLETYQRSDVFVLACVVDKGGDRDGIPVVLIEALAMQLPTVSTQVSGIPELVRHEETGLLVAPRDDVALAQALQRLGRDKELRERLAHSGRALVLTEFDIHKNARRLADLFEALIQERAK